MDAEALLAGLKNRKLRSVAPPIENPPTTNLISVAVPTANDDCPLGMSAPIAPPIPVPIAPPISVPIAPPIPVPIAPPIAPLIPVVAVSVNANSPLVPVVNSGIRGYDNVKQIASVERDSQSNHSQITKNVLNSGYSSNQLFVNSTVVPITPGKTIPISNTKFEDLDSSGEYYGVESEEIYVADAFVDESLQVKPSERLDMNIIREIHTLRGNSTQHDRGIIAHFPLNYLRAAGFSVENLYKIGKFKAYAMKNQGGFTAKELLSSGYYMLTEIKRVGYSCSDVRNANIPLSSIITIGYTIGECIAAGFSLSEIRETNLFKLADIKKLNFIHVNELIEAGYTGIELRNAGYLASELTAFYGHNVINNLDEYNIMDDNSSVHTGNGTTSNTGVNMSKYVTIEKSLDNCKYLKSCGYTSKELKDAGYTLKELKRVGFQFNDVKGLGYPRIELLTNGYHTHIESLILKDIYNELGGKHWINAYHWNTAYISSYHGITVETYSERIVHVKLSNNNLQGILPDHFALLLHLQTLSLNNNNIQLPSLNDSNNAYIHICKLPNIQYINVLCNIYPSGLERFHYVELKNSVDIKQYVDLVSNTTRDPSIHTNESNKHIINSTNNKIVTQVNHQNTVLHQLIMEKNNQLSVTMLNKGGTPLKMNSHSKSIINHMLPSHASPTHAEHDYVAQQKEALRTLYYATNGHKWKNNTNWCRMDLPLNQWYGITTNKFQDEYGICDYITKINLAQNGLKGNIPDEFYISLAFDNVSYIKSIDFRFNQLSGFISNNIIVWKDSLEELFIHSNKLTGNINTWIIYLQQLKAFNGSNNSFNFSITTEDIENYRNNLTKLNHFNIKSNLVHIDIQLNGNNGNNGNNNVIHAGNIIPYMKSKLPWCLVLHV